MLRTNALEKTFQHTIDLIDQELSTRYYGDKISIILNHIDCRAKNIQSFIDKINTYYIKNGWSRCNGICSDYKLMITLE